MARTRSQVSLVVLVALAVVAGCAKMEAPKIDTQAAMEKGTGKPGLGKGKGAEKAAEEAAKHPKLQ